MIKMRKGFDSATVVPRCDYCGLATGFLDGDMILIGTGNSLMACYHVECFEKLTKYETNQPTNQRRTS